MVKIKTASEIRLMQEAGKRLKKVVKELLPKIKPGVSTKFIDQEAEKLIRETGDEPSFQKVRNYRWSTCLPINEQIVHTPPSERRVMKGDLLTVDMGLWHKGYNTDFATTFVVGENKDKKIERFLKAGQDTLDKVINKVKDYKYIGEISASIEQEIYRNGYFVTKELTGHGIGQNLHEEPYIPGFLDRPVEKTYKIRDGLAVAIEIIYSMSSEDIKYEDGSDWSIVTADGSLSACFEHTIAFSDKKVLKIT